METIDFETSTTTTVAQDINHDMSVEESMSFRNMEASDFPPCRVRYFNLKLDIVAILASQEAKKFKSLTCETQIGDISTEDEASRLLAEMHNTMKEVAESEFYSKMTDQLRNDPDIQSNLKRVLGSHSHILMVIYALGSIEYSYRSQYQLAIALLLKNDFSSWIGEIEVFDPMFSPCDCLVMEELGCKVLSVNEQCRREVKKPTLFYMPEAETCHISNVLDANWCPSQINTMILLCVCPGQHHFDFIKKYMSEFKICGLENKKAGWVFTNYFWTFFNVEPELDMETLFPGNCNLSISLFPDALLLFISIRIFVGIVRTEKVERKWKSGEINVYSRNSNP